MRVLVILGHPRTPSLCASLADAYAEGVRAAGLEVAELDVGKLDFDPDVHPHSPREQPLEPDLERALELIVWAQHIAFFFPAWWGVGPARLRGFLDRVLLPDVAFSEGENGRYVGLLHGRTAHLVLTMDTPPVIYRLLQRAPGINAMKRSVLGFCGVDTTAVLAIGPVKGSSVQRRTAWVERARGLGFSLSRGARTPAGRVAERGQTWLKALRLQFYPFTWMAYTVGALGATAGSVTAATWDTTAYWVGYAVTFFVEVATVFINECWDFESDRRNRHFGPFTGGSRVLVDESLDAHRLRVAALLALLVAIACAGWLLDREGVDAAALGLLTALMFVLGPGYTAPPIKLSWRGLGELDVAFTHSIGVVLFGHLAQGGHWSDPFPWLLSAPLFIAVLPSIILSGVPDVEADAAAGKRTLAVRLGIAGAMNLALVLTVTAALAAAFVKEADGLRGALDGVLVWVLPHALLLAVLLYRERERRKSAGRIDALMIASLAYILWFVLVPLYNLA